MKDNKKLWGGRFTKKTNSLVEEYTESISFDHRLYKYDIRGTIAHVEMLGECRIIPKKESEKLVSALRDLEIKIEEKIQSGAINFTKDTEDIHTYIEKHITAAVGDETGGKIHTARSRNDQIALDVRLYVRYEIKEIVFCLNNLCANIIDLAEKYSRARMPGYTHMQPARPIYFRDYIRTYLEMLLRDVERMRDSLKRMNYSPLGAEAIAGSHHKINRQLVAEKLNFSGVVENTIDAVSDRDFIIEFIFCLSVIMMHISRLSEELILWVNPQFKFVEIDSAFMTGSSILPQKKNPDVCELARGKTGRVYGNLMAILTLMKGIPLSYNRDMQEDKRFLFDSVDTVKSTLKVYAEMFKNVTVNEISMLSALRGGYITAPLLADTLVQHNISIRKVHEIVGKLVAYCEKNNIDFDRIGEGHIFGEEDYIQFAEMLDDELISFLDKDFVAEDKVKILKKVFSKKILEKISLDKYIYSVNEISADELTKQFDNDRNRLKTLLIEVENF